jgi:hypothetical protein
MQWEARRFRDDGEAAALNAKVGKLRLVVFEGQAAPRARAKLSSSHRNTALAGQRFLVSRRQDVCSSFLLSTYRTPAFPSHSLHVVVVHGADFSDGDGDVYFASFFEIQSEGKGLAFP